MAVWERQQQYDIWPFQLLVDTPEALKSCNYTFHLHIFQIPLVESRTSGVWPCTREAHPMLAVTSIFCWISLFKNNSFLLCPGFEENRFVNIRPSAAWLHPSDATVHAWLHWAGHDGQKALQTVRKARVYLWEQSCANNNFKAGYLNGPRGQNALLTRAFVWIRIGWKSLQHNQL